jgi:hypothetical protein
VPALKVRFVVVDILNARMLVNIDIVLEPRLIVLTFELLLAKALVVTLKFAVVNVPAVTPTPVPADVVSALPSVTVIPTPLTFMPVNVLPAVVSVPVPVIVVDLSPGRVYVIVALSVMLPATVKDVV